MAKSDKEDSPADKAADKKMGIKEGSSADTARDKDDKKMFGHKGFGGKRKM